MSEPSLKELADKSLNPVSEWRGSPFWAWNGKMDPEEVRRQIRGFKECGLGGFFMHARTGLQTAYLSDEWFASIGAAIDEAEKLGMEAWIYDEDRYPSGSGGGIITKNPKYRAKGIFIEIQDARAAQAPLPEFIRPENIVAVFAARIRENTASHIRQLDLATRPALQDGESSLIFYTDTITCSPWYNNYTYMDTMCKEAVRAFLDLTHEAYKKRFSDKFGKCVPGLFTDEPRYGFLVNQPLWDREHRDALPWTPGLLELFQETFGYDVRTRLPELFFEVDGVDSVEPRVNYVSTMMKMFMEAFAGQIGQWCRENNLIFTGHTVGEDSLSYQTSVCGDAMRFYEHMDMPGMDLLTEHHRGYQTAKQVASVAHQLGKQRRLCEVYGCTGWDFPGLGFKALGDWLFALGINYRCQHLASYTMEGEAKRDYPCPVALQTNDKETSRQCEDYFARLGVWLSHGREDRRILVISTIESAWSLFHRKWRTEKATQDYDREFNRLSHVLLANHLDFDYGDEELLSRHGDIRNRELLLGQAAYDIVILPRAITLRSTTLSLLKRFQDSGGTVLTVNAAPTHIDAKPYQEGNWPFPLLSSEDEILAAVEPVRQVSLTGEDGRQANTLLYQLRRGSDYDCLFLCNTGHPVDQDCDDGAAFSEPFVLDRRVTCSQITIRLKTAQEGALLEFDPQDGSFSEVPARREDGCWLFAADFPRLASHLFLAVRDKSVIEVKARIPETACTRLLTEIAPSSWSVELSEPNVAVIDHFAKDGSQDLKFILTLDDELHSELNLELRGGVMAEPWCRECDHTIGGDIKIHTSFEAEFLPTGPLWFVIERPELYTMQINGQAVTLVDDGAWHEPAWRKCLLPDGLLVSGKNTITLTTRLTNDHPGLETTFLLGNFGVRPCGNSFCLTAPVTELQAGDWTYQGLPFYSGDVTYRTQVSLPSPVHGAAITVKEFASSAVRVRINGQTIGKLLFAPARTAAIDLPQTFTLELAVTGSLRNTLGPFFQPELRPTWCGPYQFKAVDVQDRQFIVCGLLDGAQVWQ